MKGELLTINSMKMLVKKFRLSEIIYNEFEQLKVSSGHALETDNI